MSKITIDRAVVEQALEAFNVATTPLARDRQEVLKAMEALRAALEQPQVEQEPDAFYEWWRMRPSLTRLQAWLLWKDEHPQPPRQPLTNEQLNCLWRQTLGEPHAPRKSAFDFARAIEAAHGIKEQK